MRPVRRSVFTQLGRRLRSPKSVRILFRISDHPTSTVDRTRPWMTQPLLVSGPDYYKTLRFFLTEMSAELMVNLGYVGKD
ncbi:hypothetical protein ACOSP7_011049 [Xanthoceras sorbifolium]